jgi:hypothetical protein
MCVAFCASLLALAQTDDDAIERYAKKVRDSKAEIVADFKAALQELKAKSAPERRGASRLERRSIDQRVQAAEAFVKGLEAGKEVPRFILNLERPSTGDVGELPGLGDVVQVTSDTTMLFLVRWTWQSSKVNPFDGTTGWPLTKGDRLVHVEMPSTQGMTDGSEVTLHGMFEVVGTRTYKTIAGTNTVWHLRKVTATKTPDTKRSP